MLHSGYVSNEMLREWGLDRVAATTVLRDLVDAGVAIKEGGRRYARYVLADGGPRRTPDLFSELHPASPPHQTFSSSTEKALVELGEASAAELAAASATSRKTVRRHLDVLLASGLVAGIGAPRSPKRRYKWIGAAAGVSTEKGKP